MATPVPSMKKWFGSPAMVRSMVTPTMRCITSVTERSGNLPMSSATIESTISSAFCLIFWADCKAARWPATTTTWVPSPAGVPACAQTLPFAIMAIWATPMAIAVFLNFIIVFSVLLSLVSRRADPAIVWRRRAVSVA